MPSMRRCARRRSTIRTFLLLTGLAPFQLPAGRAAAQVTPARAEPKDPRQEGLPLKPTRTVAFTTKVGHWMSVDVTPDGQTLIFDLLGDLYTLPVNGGKATPFTHGMAFDAQPRLSPDGKRVVFVSDRDGGWNVYIMSLDKRDTLQLTRGKANTYESPEWTPDGKYIVVTRNMKLHLFHVDGGSGQQLIREPALLRTTGAAFGPDPRYIWFAQRTGQWVYNTPMSDYDLAVYDRNTGQTSIRENRWGSAFRPTLSPDGRWLVYGTRHIDTTRLRIRDLRNGDERWLVMRTQRDDQESRATLDVLPGMTFTPDSRYLITTWDGKLWKVPVEGGGALQEIPFEADVNQSLGPYVEFNYPISDSATFVAKQIRDAVPSPDGSKLAFVALDRLYLMDWPNGTPRRVSDMEVGEFQPAWSPDGQSLVYTAMSATEGGHLYLAAAAGGARPRRLTTQSFFWQHPAFATDGQRIVAVRGPMRSYQASVAGSPGGGEDIVWIPASGGDATVIAPSSGLSNPHFTHDPGRIYFYGGQRGLVSMRWDGTDQRTHLRVTLATPTPPGGGGGGPPGSPPAVAVFISPNGDQALAQVSGDMYIVPVPETGGTEPTISIGGTETSFPVRRLTDIGGQFPVWRGDGREVHWSIGNAHVAYDVEAGRAFDDSVRRARRDAAGGADSGRAGSRGPVPMFKPFEKRIILNIQRDIPKQAIVLRGARVITMKGKEILGNGDIVIRDNRIVGVGGRGSVRVPSGARVIDLSGKTIIPGFVDTHAHVRATFDIHREQVWSYQANLAYGVTTLRDPQTATTDVLSYEDMVTAGKIVGPRIYSTGPGVFGASNPTGNNLTSLDQARSILKRYSQYYDTKTIKEYQVGNREQRQWVIMAANELGLMPTTEGGLDYKMNITEAIDGYSGHEHTIPTFPLQADMIRFYAESKTVYTPTIIVAYGGPWGENYWYEHEDLLNDEKLKRFTPWSDLEGKILRRGGGNQAGWFHTSQYVMKPVGESIRDLIAAGGRAGVGSHGQLQGLGYHWELWSMAMGGLSNHDALMVATRMGADAIGLGKEVGSLEPGKLADLLVLDQNPLTNLRNTSTIRIVMKNGRMYDGQTLELRKP